MFFTLVVCVCVLVCNTRLALLLNFFPHFLQLYIRPFSDSFFFEYVLIFLDSLFSCFTSVNKERIV